MLAERVEALKAKVEVLQAQLQEQQQLLIDERAASKAREREARAPVGGKMTTGCARGSSRATGLSRKRLISSPTPCSRP